MWQRDGEGELILLRRRAKGKALRAKGDENTGMICHTPRSWPFALSSLLPYFPPLKISQSCEEVPMKSNIGSDSQALVREAMKA